MQTEQVEQAGNLRDEFMAHMRAAAIEYMDRGWVVIPISIKDKTPLIEWRDFQQRGPTREMVEEWFRDGVTTGKGNVVPVFNIGVLTGSCSGIVVVDCDNIAALEYAEANGLTSDFISATRRGRQYFFQHPKNGQRYANKGGGTGHNWPKLHGLDFRGDGGFVIVPPSTYFHGDGTHKHTYEWLDEDQLDWSAMPVWRGKPTVQEVGDDFRFEEIDLAEVKLSMKGVADELREHIGEIGHTLRDGEGRNNWLTRYAGEQCRAGYLGRDLAKLCSAFQDEFFNEHLDAREVAAMLRSVQQIDRRNHPDDYDASGKRVSHDAASILSPMSRSIDLSTLRPIYCDDVPDLLKAAGEKRYWLEPLVEPASIVQFVGFNGSGKTFVLMNALWSASMGKSFGPFRCVTPPKVLYFDWELSVGITGARMSEMESLYGNPGRNFALWSQSTHTKQHGDMNLQVQEGVDLFGAWITGNKPDIVVIDTVRSAFVGLDENSVEHWGRFNKIIKFMRNQGITVVFVHHRNKGNIHGMGREAGSTAQLTDVDTQVMVTKVVRTKEEALLEAAAFNGDTAIMDLSGRKWNAWEYLAKRLPTDWRLKYVAEVSYGKVRQRTELHIPHYVGLAECLKSGAKRVVSTLSPRQQAERLHASGLSAWDISARLDIPSTTIESWLA